MIKILDVTRLGPEARQMIEAIERGDEQEIIFVRDGRTIARLVVADEGPSTVRLRLTKGMFKVPKDIDSDNEEVHEMFEGNNSRGSHE